MGVDRVQARLEAGADGPTVVLTFPYNPWLVSMVKTISVRKWDPINKVWRVPYSPERWREVTTVFGGVLDPTGELLDIFRADVVRQEKSQSIKLAGDAEVKGYTYATEPYAHQRAGLAFLAENKAAGLLWEMGSGKTKTIIDDICYRGLTLAQAIFPVLVFCPSEVMYTQWLRQVPLHSGGLLTVEVLDGPITRRRKRLAESTAHVLVLNVESALYLSKELLARKWGYVVLDEATRFKNHRAQRTKTILKMHADVKRILTGTPITNSPIDAYAPFTFLNPALFGNWWAFEDRYLVTQRPPGRAYKEVLGFKNLDDLSAKVRAYSYRVLKEDVLDLPEKTYTDMEVELDGETLEAYEAMRDKLRVSWRTVHGDEKETKARIMVTQLLRLAQIAAGVIQSGDDHHWIAKNPKLRACEALLDDVIFGDRKAVIFAVYRHEIEALLAHFARFRPVVLYGDVPLKERAASVAAFQDPRSPVKLMIAQMHSGGIGIDLTAAQTAIYYTRNWSLEDYLQSQDRLHRIGQSGTVNIVSLVATLPNDSAAKAGRRRRATISIDQAIRAALQKKQKLADTVTGDRANTAGQEAVAAIESVLGT